MFISCRFTIAVLHLSVTRMHSSYHPDEVFAICYPDSLLFSISERNSLLSLVILGLVPWRKKKWNLWSKFILCSPECSGSKSTRAQRFIPTICNPNSALKYMFKWAQKNIYRSQIYNNIIKPYMRAVYWLAVSCLCIYIYSIIHYNSILYYLKKMLLSKAVTLD